MHHSKTWDRVSAVASFPGYCVSVFHGFCLRRFVVLRKSSV